MARTPLITKASALGHKNLKDVLEGVKETLEDKAITPAGLNDIDTDNTAFQSSELTFRIGNTEYTVAASTSLQITSGQTVAGSTYAAFVVLIDSAGAVTTVKAADAPSKVEAIALLSAVTIPASRAVLGFLVVSGAFTPGTTEVSANVNVDFYSCGGMALASGLSTDGDTLLGAL